MDERFDEKICHADSETWDRKMLMNSENSYVKSTLTIDVAR